MEDGLDGLGACQDSTLGWRQESGENDIAIAFRPPEALEEEDWQWRARVQTGGVPTESARPSPFRVDVTPPAEIEGLKVQRRPDGAVLLRWDPVTQDLEGRPESVDHYVVYRYDRRGTFPQVPLVKVGESRLTTYIDRRGVDPGKVRQDGPPLLAPEPPPPPPAGRSATGGKSAADGGPIYYKIVAVDVAGNELGSRENTAGTGRSRAPVRPRPSGASGP